MGGLKVDNVDFNNLLNIYNREIRKNVQNKKKIYEFENHKMENIINLFIISFLLKIQSIE